MNDLYSRSIIIRKVVVKFVQLNSDLEQIFREQIAHEIEGKCIVQGYVVPESVVVIDYSSGSVRGASVTYDVKFECMIFLPSSGLKLDCVVKSNTAAGIMAESPLGKNSPFVVFVIRDHDFTDSLFNSLQKGDKFTVRVNTFRFELNDSEISIIAKIV